MKRSMKALAKSKRIGEAYGEFNLIYLLAEKGWFNKAGLNSVEAAMGANLYVAFLFLDRLKLESLID